MFDGLLIARVWLIGLLIQLAWAPVMILITKRWLVDGGWIWARLVGWLVTGSMVWWLAHAGLPINTQWGVLGITVATSALAAGLGWWRLLPTWRQWWQRAWWMVICEELLFLGGLVWMGWVRSFNPDILDLEKFMDAGLMVSYTKSPILPAIDMWLAGQTINYYTFGHFLGSVLIRIWHTPIEYGYNLALGYLCGLIAGQSFSLGMVAVAPLLSKKDSPKPLFIAGITASFLLIFSSNSHPLWYWLSHGSFAKFWYPDSTRFIDRTIHEFPAYSFVVSDLHAHLWSLPIVLLFLTCAWLWLQQWLSKSDEAGLITAKSASIKSQTILQLTMDGFKSIWNWSLVLGALLGILVMTSTWDVAIYSMFLGILSLWLLISDPKRFLRLLASAVTIVVTAALVSAAWWLNFTNISQGVLKATEHTPFWQLLVLWTTHLVIAFLSCLIALALIKRKQQLVAWWILTLAITAVILIVIPELIFVKDIYPSHPRANTMFKLVFQAIILLSFSFSWLLGVLLIPRYFSQISRKVLGTLATLALIGLGMFPFLSYRSYYREFSGLQTLDGLLWMKQQLPEDFLVVDWFRRTIPTGQRPVILEAVGDSYTQFARISTFSGLPTVLGWRVHEWLWRGGFTIPGERTEEVKKIYNFPLDAESQALLKKYKVRYLVVGDKEREAYPEINEADLKTLGDEVFAVGATYVIELPQL